MGLLGDDVVIGAMIPDQEADIEMEVGRFAFPSGNPMDIEIENLFRNGLKVGQPRLLPAFLHCDRQDIVAPIRVTSRL